MKIDGKESEWIMRILNQKSAPVAVDLPYSKVVISQHMLRPNEVIAVSPLGSDDDIYTLAIYSSESKARKAIELLHDAYGDIIRYKYFRFPEDYEL